MSKIGSIICGLAIFISGCQLLRFDRYPGTATTEIPQTYCGTYQLIDKRHIKPNDTVIVIVDKYSYTQIEKNKKTVTFLDSTHIFSTFQNHHFLFEKEADYWIGFSVAKKGNNLSLIPLIPSRKAKDKLKLLKKYFDNVELVKGTQLIDGEEQIDDSYYKVRMDEDQLLRYLSKLKKQNVTFKNVN